MLGDYVLRMLVVFLMGLLDMLLLFADVELAIAERDMSSKAEVFVMLVCTVVSLVGSIAALGFRSLCLALHPHRPRLSCTCSSMSAH